MKIHKLILDLMGYFRETDVLRRQETPPMAKVLGPGLATAEEVADKSSLSFGVSRCEVIFDAIAEDLRARKIDVTSIDTCVSSLQRLLPGAFEEAFIHPEHLYRYIKDSELPDTLPLDSPSSLRQSTGELQPLHEVDSIARHDSLSQSFEDY